MLGKKKPPFCVTYTNILAYKTARGPNMNQGNTVCVGYARVGFALGMKISYCSFYFCLHWVANTNAVSDGILVLD